MSSPVYVNDGLTFDFIDDDGAFPIQHFCFRVTHTHRRCASLARLNLHGEDT